MVLYPMLAENRQIERRADLIQFLKRFEPADAIGQAYYLLASGLYHFDNTDILSVDTLLKLDAEMY